MKEVISIKIKLTIIILLCAFILYSNYILIYKANNFKCVDSELRDDVELLDAKVRSLNCNNQPAVVEKIVEKIVEVPVKVNTEIKSDVRYSLVRPSLSNLKNYILSLDYNNKVDKKDMLSSSIKKNIEKLVEIGQTIEKNIKNSLEIQKNKTLSEEFNQSVDRYNNLEGILFKLIESSYISNPHLISIKITLS